LATAVERIPEAAAGEHPLDRRLLAVALLLSAGSGLAALIYEIVWFQLLELQIGSTALSLAALFATFMGGMCLGSLILPRLVSGRHNPLRIYAAIELGVGALAILALWLMPAAGRLAAVILLLPPTILMGATLPVLARRIPAPSRLGLLYAANIVGAVLGCLLAGFYLLPNFDVSVATYVAVGINLAGAGIACCIKQAHPHSVQDRLTEPRPPGSGLIYSTIALSGLCALAAEVIWTRLLGLLFGASVYALSIILAVFLIGLGLGSAGGAWLSNHLLRPRLALGWCQLLAAAAIAWAAFNMDAWLPYWPIDPSLSSRPWFNFQLDIARALWALLPPTLLWGASFPLALASAGSQPRDSAKLMSGVYAANTFGAIIGALGASLLLVSWLGSQRAQQVLIAVSILSGLLAMPRRRLIVVPAALAGGLLGALLIRGIPPIAKVALAYGRYTAPWVGKSEVIYAGEGMNSFVAVASFPNGVRTFHVAGKIQASNVPRDMRLQRMLGHLTTLSVAQPRSVLVIGCGAGVTAGAVSIDPRVERETVVEIEALVPQAASAYFSDANFNVLHNPKVHVRIDDGRHFLLTAKERFDAITIDPLDPWVKGAANFYTEEFLQSMKQRLNPGGAVTVYVQLFQTNLDAVKSSVATFFEVFPNATIWGNPYQRRGYDMVLMGQVEPLRIDLDEMERRFGYRDEHNQIPQSLAEIGIDSPVDLFATYAGRKSDLAGWLQSAVINRDRNLRMQYLAGLGLNRDDSAAIYSSLLAYRRFPEDIFSSAEGRLDSLRRAMLREQ
jgi:spermidine synthase